MNAIKGADAMPRRQVFDRALQAADPIPAETLKGAKLDATLDELGAALTLKPKAPGDNARARTDRRRRRLRLPRTTRGVALAGAVGLLVVGGATAATTILTTYTGQYNKGWQVQAGGPGEMMLEGAPNFCAAALKLSSDIAYPAGYQAWRPWVLITEAGQPKVTDSGACGSNSAGGEGGDTEVSTGALHGWFAMSAFCAWIYDWRDAENSGDTAETSQAASVIAGALSWPAVRAEDPSPSAAPVSETSHGLDGAHSLFGWFMPFQSAVKSDDVGQVSDLITSNYGEAGCSAFDPPASSDGGTVNPAVDGS